MAPASLLALALSSATFAGASGFGTTSEWIVTGDLNGNGRSDVVVADKETGIFRVGFGRSSGGYTWMPFHPSGIRPIDDATAGHFQSKDFESVAFAGQGANRIQTFRFDDGSVHPPQSAFTSGVGPAWIAVAGDTAYSADSLLAVAIDNGASTPSWPESFGFGTAGPQSTWDSASTRATHSLKTFVYQRGERPAAVWLTSAGTAPSAWGLHGVLVANGQWDASMPETVAMGSQLASGHFIAGNNSGYVLIYQPETPTLQIHAPALSGGILNLPAVGSIEVDFRLGAVRALPNSGGADLVLAINAAFQEAIVYRIDDFTSVTRIEEISPAAGHITGVATDGMGGFSLFTGATPGGPSTGYTHFGFDGTGYSVLAEETFPEWPAPERFPASIVLFEGEALVDDRARVRGRLFAGDWTRSAVASPTITTESERFRSESLGLGDPATLSLGPTPDGVDYALANQFLANISFVSLEGPVGRAGGSVDPSPLPGTYHTSILVSFPSAFPDRPEGLHVRYRIHPDAEWETYTGGFWLYKKCSLQWLTVDPDSGAKSPVRSGSYTFPAPPHDLDSDGDGIPDFVKIHVGLDPLGGTGAEGDGVSALEDLLFGEGSGKRIDPGSTFDALVTIRPFAWLEKAYTHVLSGATLLAYSPSGSPLSGAAADINASFFPAILLSEMDIDRARPYWVLATARNFGIETAADDPRAGREILAMIERPAIERPEIDYVYGRAELAQEAKNWIEAARKAYEEHTRTRLEGDLAPADTLHAALVEKAFGDRLRARRGDPEESFTAFPFRSADAGRTPIDADRLAEIGRPAGNHLPHRPADVLGHFNSLLFSGSNDAEALIALAEDVYRIASQHGSPGLGHFAMPIEAFRYFLESGQLPESYLPHSTLSAAQRQLATDTAAGWLGSTPPRPFVSLSLEVGNSPPTTTCTILRDPGTGQNHALLRSNGRPFRLPASFSLPPGTVLTVHGYDDVTSPCANAAVEVTHIALISFSAPQADDEDGNLLPDSWERFFLGQTGNNPFASPDGSGFSALQQFLDGTDPTNPSDLPSGAPVDLSPPDLHVSRAGGNITIEWNWPEAYADNFRFRIAESPDLQAFAPQAQEGTHIENGRFAVTLPVPESPGTTRFYRVEISLR